MSTRSTLKGNQPAAQRWALAIAGALLLHASPFAALAIGLLHFRSPPAAASDAIMIELAPLPEAPPSPPSAMPAGPEQVASQQPQRQRPRPEEPVLAETILPEPEEAAEAAPETTAPAHVEATPSERVAAPSNTASAHAAATITWQGRVLAQLDRHKRYPSTAARRRQEGVPQVRFTLDRQGRVLAVSLARTSSVASLDSEAVALVRRAAPFPPPPPHIQGEAIELQAPVEFFLR